MVNLVSTRTPRPFSAKLSSRYHPQHGLVREAVPPQAQDLVHPLAELHEVPERPFPQPVETALGGSTSLWCTSCSSQFCVVCEGADGMFPPVTQMPDEDVKWDWTQY